MALSIAGPRQTLCWEDWFVEVISDESSRGTAPKVFAGRRLGRRAPPRRVMTGRRDACRYRERMESIAKAGHHAGVSFDLNKDE